MMEQCALIISANESYERGEKDLEKFTGIPVSHSRLQRLVNSQKFELPTSKPGVQQITLDGVKSGYVTKTRVSRVIGKIIKPCVWIIFIVEHFFKIIKL